MKISTSGQNAIIGALVADAATMGLHWLYDQARIAELATTMVSTIRPDIKAHFAITSAMVETTLAILTELLATL